MSVCDPSKNVVCGCKTRLLAVIATPGDTVCVCTQHEYACLQKQGTVQTTCIQKTSDCTLIL
jgi:hypothetical protein